MSRESSIESDRWRDNWRTLCPGDAVRIDLGARDSGRDVARAIRDLPAGTPVVLAASWPAGARRCRAVAARSGVRLDREFLAIPNVRAPGCFVENAPGPARAFLRSVLVAPHQSRFGPVLDVALAVLRALGSRRALAMVAPGRLVVGTRT